MVYTPPQNIADRDRSKQYVFLAGGDWDRIKEIIQEELKDCEVTVVIYKP